MLPCGVINYCPLAYIQEITRHFCGKLFAQVLKSGNTYGDTGDMNEVRSILYMDAVLHKRPGRLFIYIVMLVSICASYASLGNYCKGVPIYRCVMMTAILSKLNISGNITSRENVMYT